VKKSKKKVEAEIIVKQSVNTDTKECMARILTNTHTDRDLIHVGDKLYNFKFNNDVYCIIAGIVDSIIRNQLTLGKQPNNTSEEMLGIMRGAQSVLDNIEAYIKEGQIATSRFTTKNQEEETEEDNENLEPVVSKGKMSI
jgi:hypothetical protein